MASLQTVSAVQVKEQHNKINYTQEKVSWCLSLTGEQAVQMSMGKEKEKRKGKKKDQQLCVCLGQTMANGLCMDNMGTMQWPARGQKFVGHTSPLLFGKADSSPFTSLDTISRNSDWWARP